MASPPQIKILSQIQVSPSPEAAAPDSAGHRLSFFDIAWLHTGPVERLFFYPYPHPTSHFLSHSLPTLHSSLSLSLQRFYLLSGHVIPSPSDPSQFIYSYSSGDSITLTVAESESPADFEEISSSRSRDFSKLSPLVPQLPRSEDGSIPLCALQVTLFPNHGICIGVSIHHVACDDSSALHFVKSWASACKLGGFDSADSPPPPIYDRSVIADPNGLYSKTLSEMRELASNGPPPPPPSAEIEIERPSLFISSFFLSRDQVDSLKQSILFKVSDSGATVHCTAFTVACAFSWVSLLNSQVSNRNKERSHLLFSVDCRARLSPQVPTEYFGNCLRPCFVEANTEDLLRDDVNGIVTAALAIGKSIKELENGVLDGAEGWLKRVLSVLPEQPMSIGGSPRFRVYDVDFGWGRPRKVEMVSIEKTPGTVSLSENGGDERGGIEIGVVLPLAEMELFASCFSDGIKLIQV